MRHAESLRPALRLSKKRPGLPKPIDLCAWPECIRWETMTKKVFVSGCFDMLHSGHVEFFRQAAQYGDLYVALGSDKTIFDLKGRETVNSEQERLFMVKSVSFVKDAFISRGSGILDFEVELRQLMPDCLVTNSDGHLPEKRDLCRRTWH